MIDSIISNQGSLLVKGNIDDKDVTLNSNRLKKTKDYGGRGAGSGTRVEDAALAAAVFGLNKLNDGKAVDISFNGVVYSDIVTATTVPKTPKADFSFDNGLCKTIDWFNMFYKNSNNYIDEETGLNWQ